MTTPTILSTLQSDLSNGAVSVSSAVASFFASALVGWGSDEAKILNDAVSLLISKVQSGSSWEEASTAAYNEFYNEELAEGQKIALQLLSLISSLTSTLESIV